MCVGGSCEVHDTLTSARLCRMSERLSSHPQSRRDRRDLAPRLSPGLSSRVIVGRGLSSTKGGSDWRMLLLKGNIRAGQEAPFW